MSALPRGWAWASPDDVAEKVPNALTIGPFGSDLKVSDYRDSGVPLVFVREIRARRFGDVKTKFVDHSKAAALARHYVRPGDVLITKMGDPPGDTAIYPDHRPPAIITADCIRLTPDPAATTPSYLARCLCADSVKAQLLKQTAGVAQQKLSLERFRRVRIPLAPLPEQRRIADKLDTMLARVDACRERLDRVPGILKRFRQSVLAAATNGELTREWREERGRTVDAWTSTTVGQIITRVEAGLNVKCDERPPTDGERGLVKISAVTWGTYNDDESKTLPSTAVVPEQARIRLGDFLISRANTLELVGACVIVHRVTRPVFLSDKVLRLVVPDELKSWLLVALQSPSGRLEIETRASGNQLSMRNLSQDSLRAVPVPIPPPDERAEILRRVAALLDRALTLGDGHRKADIALQRLTPSILAKAFRGDLVPQDASDEPATALLARLRTDEGSTPQAADMAGRRRNRRRPA